MFGSIVKASSTPAPPTRVPGFIKLVAGQAKVKKKFCDGDQNFVVDVNENQEVTIGRLTKAFSSNRNATLIEKAVTDYAFSAGSAYQRILFENDRKFERKRTQTMEAIAKTVLTCALRPSSCSSFFWRWEGGPGGIK